VRSNTVGKQRKATGKPFTKGDARINRNGRPKVFDFIRGLAQDIGDEIDPIQKRINAEVALRRLLRDDPKVFLEIAYGKVKDEVELSSPEDRQLVVKVIKVDE
jgi:hypothetical protein